MKSLATEGESQTLEIFDVLPDTDGSDIAERIEAFVRQSRTLRNITIPNELPASVVVLACLKLRSPLPAEFWRLSIFGKLEPSATAPESP